MKINLTSIILFVLLCFAVFWILKERDNKPDTAAIAKQKEVLKNPEAPAVGKHTDEKGQHHGSFDVSANKVDGKLVAVSPSIVDTISRLSNVKPSQVTDWQAIAITSRAELLKASRKIDSLNNVVYEYKGKYISLSYRPGKIQTDTVDAGLFGYRYDAIISRTDYTQGLRLLGIPVGFQQSIADIYGDDPNMTINGLRSLKIEAKKQNFGLNGYAFANYLFSDKDMQIGAGAQIDLGRLSLNGGYYYNTQDFDNLKQPKPFAGAKFNFFK